MNTTTGIVLGTGATIGLTLLVNHLVKTGMTAGKLDIFLEDFSFSAKGIGALGATIPNINFNAKLNIKNPTGNDLTISQPYIKVFYKDDTNPIGVSIPSDKTYVIKAKQTTPIEINVEFASIKVLPQMPDIVKYMAKRVFGAASTRNVKMEMQVSGNGINQTVKQTIAI